MEDRKSNLNTESRKKDHIDLAFDSVVHQQQVDDRFLYEPMLSAHPQDLTPLNFLGKTMLAPIWVSSMTGGTEKAGIINKNLARACGEFGLGLGLGSCRSLLHDDNHLEDFNVREYMGDQPLYANLGIAQVENLISDGKTNLIKELLIKLQADGLIIHVNPLQEWFQPEGDFISHVPIDTIKHVLDADLKLIVKEVGQGMGKESLRALMKLPLEAIEFAAMGGTNFSKLELLRSHQEESFLSIANVGHTAEQMTSFVNDILVEESVSCNQFIVSGGIRGFLDGYYLINKVNSSAIYGQASSFLKYAMNDYSTLRNHVEDQIKGLQICNSYLRLKEQ